MALSTEDLKQIREVVFEGMQATVEALNPRFEALEKGQDELKTAQQETNRRLDNLETSQRETTGRLTKLEQRFDTFEGKLEAIENDIKELYAMIQATPEIKTKTDFKQYAESVILDAHKRLQALAKESGVTLPPA